MIRVPIVWERRTRRPLADRLRRLARAALAALEIDGVEVSVLIAGDERLRELNRTFRATDRATDVLSFPSGDELPDGTRLLGGIAISLDAARRQAEELGHDVEREVEELLLHGLIHLAGYDHERDDGQMNALELELREKLLP